jgi:hypothetical protein
MVSLVVNQHSQENGQSLATAVVVRTIGGKNTYNIATHRFSSDKLYFSEDLACLVGTQTTEAAVSYGHYNQYGHLRHSGKDVT